MKTSVRKQMKHNKYVNYINKKLYINIMGYYNDNYDTVRYDITRQKYMYVY